VPEGEERVKQEQEIGEGEGYNPHGEAVELRRLPPQLLLAQVEEQQ